MVWMKVPYTNFHNLNQDWIIRRMQEFEDYMKEIVQISVIKYADPIQWRITGQYEQSTVVIDAETGVAYISVRPVPAGIAITNTDYWTPVFDLQQILGNIEQDLADEATARENADQTLQSNIDSTNAALAAEVTNRENADTDIIGDLSAEITNRENADTDIINNITELSLQVSRLKNNQLMTRKDFWVDGYDGDDSNDGSENYPFKTLDAALDMVNNGYPLIFITFKRGGDYYVTPHNITSVTWHMQKASGNNEEVKIHFDGGFPVYNSHLNWRDVTIDFPNSGYLYIDNCFAIFQSCKFNQYFASYGGQVHAENCTFNRVNLNHTLFQFSGTTTLEPDSTVDTLISFGYGSYGVFTGDIVINGNPSGTVSGGCIIYLTSGMMSYVVGSVTNNTAFTPRYGLRMYQSVFIGSTARLNALNAAASYGQTYNAGSPGLVLTSFQSL